MSLILEQSFPLGRFHATRWNQNPFEDRHGEWPPSPWRLLRALAARWFQYARETGDEDEELRNQLLGLLASKPPVFCLPAFTWPGQPSPRQYQKTEVAWTDASAKAAAYKKPRTTLVMDVFRAISPTAGHLGMGRGGSLATARDPTRRIAQSNSLFRTCRNTLPICNWDFAERLAAAMSCRHRARPIRQCWSRRPGKAQPRKPARLHRRPPLQRSPDSAWDRVALRPLARVPNREHSAVSQLKLPPDLHVIQFAVGGRVYPEQAHWVRVIERFRGCVLKHAASIVSGGECSSYRELPADLRDKLKLLSGKDGEGRPVQNHQHVYFFLYPDEIGNPTRLIAYRRTPFDAIADRAFEVEAILAASREPIFWQSRDPDWSLRIVPLPFETVAPAGCRSNGGSAATWISATPFVPPNRCRFRENGRLRAAETVRSPREGLRRILACYGLDCGSHRDSGTQRRWQTNSNATRSRSNGILLGHDPRNPVRPSCPLEKPIPTSPSRVSVSG